MSFADIVAAVDDFAWGPVMLVLLVGTGLYLSIRSGFIQFTKFGYTMRNTIGKMFKKQDAGKGEVTPFQALTTALAATVGTGNIAGVTGAIFIGGPGAVFWLWISALVGMVTKYSEVVLAVKYRERNEQGDWVGGPMYYIRNGLGKNWVWLAYVFAFFGMIASFGIGNTTQVDSMATAISTAIGAFGGNVDGNTALRITIGVIVAVITAVVIIGGIKRIGTVTEKLVPFMAVVYIVSALIVVFGNIGQIGVVLGAIFKGAFSPRAIAGGALGVGIMTTIQKGIARGVFSNEAGLGSAPIAHAATSETNPVKQGVYGIFEVFMDSIVICTLTALALLMGLAGQVGIDGIEWGVGHGSEMVIQAFSGIFGGRIAGVIIALGLTCFALSTVLSWSLYGARCCEFLFGRAAKTATLVYKILFCVVLVIGSMLGLDIVWNIGDALNGLMAIPNLIALLALSGTVIAITKEHFGNKDTLE